MIHKYGAKMQHLESRIYSKGGVYTTQDSLECLGILIGRKLSDLSERNLQENLHTFSELRAIIANCMQ